MQSSKPLDKINLPSTWVIGLIVTILGVASAVLTNPQLQSAVGTLVTTAPLPAKLGAVGVILGILALAIGKPLGTSKGINGA